MEAEHVQELGVDKESVAQAMRVDAEPAVVGDEHDGHDAIHDVILGVVRDHRADGVGQVGAEQSCKKNDQVIILEPSERPVFVG